MARAPERALKRLLARHGRDLLVLLQGLDEGPPERAHELLLTTLTRAAGAFPAPPEAQVWPWLVGLACRVIGEAEKGATRATPGGTLRDALRRLRVDVRAAFVLRHDLHATPDEVACALGCSPEEVQAQLRICAAVLGDAALRRGVAS